ncbi:MAG: methyltransferase domain-containing protein [Beijerinckiaceae bacterium]|nr:methyltransferase domain-containing protein [Beijerinckiaceae bacterium]
MSEYETAYVDDQQGCACQNCGANLRIVALGNAVCDVIGARSTLRDFIKDSAATPLRILDINGAEGLSHELSALPHYVRADYPTVDMHNLAYATGSFDLVIHSDTLEHVSQPVRALEECRRVLAAGGRLCFTVPTIIGRMTRGRAGLPPSYHGDPKVDAQDFIVHTEFGADAWTYLMQAGFSHVAINQVHYPAALALTAWSNVMATS